MSNQAIVIPEIRRVSELPVGESIIGMLYADSGVGKTGLLGSYGSRNIILNIGNGIETLKSNWFKKKFPGCDPMVIDIREKFGPRGKIETATALDIVCDTLDHLVDKERDKFDMLSIDDMTAFSQFALSKALEINKQENKSQTLNTANAAKRFPVTAVQDYGTEMDAIKWFLGTYTNLARDKGFHFFVTAHERRIYDPPSKIGAEPKLRDVIPLFVGKDSFAPSVVPAFFDEVWWMKVEGAADQARRTLVTGRTETILAKSRHAGILEQQENVTNQSLLQLINKLKGQN